ncbi:MAG: YafY family transcriptional regulator [Clostridia bacterium]|nr:YafY family protein [Anaerotignum sp.]NCC16267.1 YafY family transcriptional regulator [Clostridia bacterium]
MQINRLLEMVYILLEKKAMTAKELAEYFEVSQRTIYRDLESLSEAGIPVYANKGKGGGIRILDNYVIKKSMVSDKDQQEIISSLQGMKALNVPDVEPVLKKLAVLFHKDEVNWIDVDFSHWGSREDEKEKFKLLKMAIIHKNCIRFDYFSSYGEKTERLIEPLQLLFKGQAWYVYGFCTTRNDDRMFKVTRIKNLIVTNQIFDRTISEKHIRLVSDAENQMVQIVLKMESTMAYRVYDEIEEEAISKNTDGSFTVTINLPENEWLYGYILSFGDCAEVLAPAHIRDRIRRKLENSTKKYL